MGRRCRLVNDPTASPRPDNRSRSRPSCDQRVGSHGFPLRLKGTDLSSLMLIDVRPFSGQAWPDWHSEQENWPLNFSVSRVSAVFWPSVSQDLSRRARLEKRCSSNHPGDPVSCHFVTIFCSTTKSKISNPVMSATQWITWTEGSGIGNRIAQTCIQLYAFDLESGRTRRLTWKAVEPDV